MRLMTAVISVWRADHVAAFSSLVSISLGRRLVGLQGSRCGLSTWLGEVGISPDVGRSGAACMVIELIAGIVGGSDRSMRTTLSRAGFGFATAVRGWSSALFVSMPI